MLRNLTLRTAIAAIYALGYASVFVGLVIIIIPSLLGMRQVEDFIDEYMSYWLDRLDSALNKLQEELEK